MATIPTDRIFALNTKTKGGPPTLHLPLATWASVFLSELS